MSRVGPSQLHPVFAVIQASPPSQLDLASPQVLRLAGTYEVQQHALLTASSYLLICGITLSCSHEVNEINILSRPSLSHGFVLMLSILPCRLTDLQAARLGYGYKLEGQSPLAIVPSSVRSRHPPGTQYWLESLS